MVWAGAQHTEAATGRVLAPGLLALWAAASLLILLPLGRHPHPRFGPANAVTALRAAGTVILVGFALAPGAFEAAAKWAALAVAALVLALDGVDGALARRSGLASRYGARFDMEVDAALTLVLSLIAWRIGAAGPAVLLLAAPHYAFRALIPALPWLGGPLPPSTMRKAVCVLQVATPLALLALPGAPGPLVWAPLTALAWSFGRDIRHLRRHAR